MHETARDSGTETNLTIRLSAATLRRLDDRRRGSGESKSRLAQRYIAEGMAMEEHPGIVFRHGPGGRRAGLAGGPDVWQVIGVLGGCDERGEPAVRRTADWLGLRPDQVRAALSYYAANQGQIDEWIERNDREAESAEAAWRRAQELLA